MPALTWRLRGEWDADEWRRRAACRDSDPDLFFPAGETGPALDQAELAKAVCRQCPVRGECLDFALASNQEAGIWGGATEAERRKLRRTWREPLRGRHFPGLATPTNLGPESIAQQSHRC